MCISPTFQEVANNSYLAGFKLPNQPTFQPFWKKKMAGRFREVADSELQDRLPKSWAQIQKATKNLTEGELECVSDSELVACWSWVLVYCKRKESLGK